MSHDLLAELTGYTNELARLRGDRAQAVREEIQRVREAVADRIGVLEAEAAEHADAGRDLKATAVSIEARRLGNALRESEDAGAAPGSETTADRTPRRTATTRGKKA